MLLPCFYAASSKTNNGPLRTQQLFSTLLRTCCDLRFKNLSGGLGASPGPLQGAFGGPPQRCSLGLWNGHAAATCGDWCPAGHTRPSETVVLGVDKCSRNDNVRPGEVSMAGACTSKWLGSTCEATLALARRLGARDFALQEAESMAAARKEKQKMSKGAELRFWGSKTTWMLQCYSNIYTWFYNWFYL